MGLSLKNTLLSPRTNINRLISVVHSESNKYQNLFVLSVTSTFIIIFLYQFPFTNFSAGANFVSPTLNFTVHNSKPFTDLAVVDTAGQKAYQYKYITSFWTVRAECVRKFSKRSRASFRTRVQSKTLSNFSGTFLVSTS